MFVITNRIPVAEGHESDFEERFRNRAHLIDRSPGFIKNQVLRPVQRRLNHKTGEFEPTTEQGFYLVQTYWETEQAFWDWTKSESLRIAHSPAAWARTRAIASFQFFDLTKLTAV